VLSGYGPLSTEQGPSSRCQILASPQYPRGSPVDRSITHARCILAVRRFVVAFASPAKRQRAKKRRLQPNSCYPRLQIFLISTASFLDSGFASQSCLSQLHTLSVSIVTITFIFGSAITIIPALQQLAFSHVPTFILSLVKQNCVLLAA